MDIIHTHDLAYPVEFTMQGDIFTVRKTLFGLRDAADFCALLNMFVRFIGIVCRGLLVFPFVLPLGSPTALSATATEHGYIGLDCQLSVRRLL